MGRHAICNEADMPVGKMKRFKVGGESILVYHLEDGFYATQSNCTHTFGPLQRGTLVDGCKIRCPIHGAQFDVRSGEVVRWANFPPGIQLLNPGFPMAHRVAIGTRIVLPKARGRRDHVRL